MVLEKTDMKTLREEYISYTRGEKSEATANSYAHDVFSLWKCCGKEFFWEVINADEAIQRGKIIDFLKSYYPNQEIYLSNYLTRIRHFSKFLAAKSVNSAFTSEQPPQRIQKIAIQKPTRNVLALTGKIVEEEHQKVLADPGYGSDYALIDSILKRFPENTDPELVALKISLFDMTYSTSIGIQRQKIVLEELAGIIVDIKDFDDRIRQGDPSIVPILARSNGKINLFSFATKYCTCHAVSVYGHDDYVIFDNIVKQALPKYVAGLRESTIENWRKTYNYDAYRNCIDELLDANGIDIPFRRRKLDHFLWHKYRKAIKEKSID